MKRNTSSRSQVRRACWLVIALVIVSFLCPPLGVLAVAATAVAGIIRLAESRKRRPKLPTYVDFRIGQVTNRNPDNGQPRFYR